MSSRRNFVKKSSLLIASTMIPGIYPLEALASVRKNVAASDQINIGLIGCKGMGFSNLTSFLKISEVNVLALCDIDDEVLKNRTEDLKKAGIKEPKHYKDYRKLLENKDIDAVIIGTPDHWHCLQLVHALEAGK